MLGITRLLRAPSAPYAREVATVLLRDGFDPAALAEMKTLGAFTQSSRIFRILAEHKLDPVDAAQAIRMASHLYQSTRVTAEAQGWPLRDGRAHAKDQPAHETYFLELLEEAVRVLRFGH